MENNYILAEINISKENINKDIRIINSFEKVKREGEVFEILNLEEDYNEKKEKKVCKYENEKEIKKNCEIKINGKNIPFNYFYKFKKIGKYEIQYIFNSNLTNINHLFFKCSSLITLDLSNYSTQNVTNMSNMFYGCRSLIKINLSNINTYNVVNMNNMFGECSSLIDLDLSNFNTLNIIDISKMFYKCLSLINIDLSSFNINNATNMNQIFYECSSLIYLDLSNFHIHYYVGKKDIFYNCSSLIKNNKKRKITIFINGYPIIKEHFFNITDSIGDIKKYIQEITDFPFSSQRLVYAGMEMTDDACFHHHIVLCYFVVCQFGF